MYSLIVRQSLNNGAVKTWKLRAGQEPHTFGSSRLAQIISIAPQTKGIQGYFEFRENSWWYVDMDIVNGAETSHCAIRVDTDLCLKIDNFTLELKPYVREPQVHKRLLNNTFTTTSSAKNRPYQLFMLKRDDLILETKLIPVKSKFRSSAFPYLAPVAVRPSENWISEFQGDFEILQKSLSVEDAGALRLLPLSEVVDPKSKRAVYAFLGLSAFLLFTSILVPHQEPTISMVAPPKTAQKIVVKTELKPKRKEAPAQKVVVQEAPPAPSAPAKENSGSGSRVSKLLGKAAGGRISQLIGKVSSQAARSNNVVIATGVKAGEGPSGRALAAVGNMEKSGRDWGQEGNGQGVTISTVGKGGGKSASGIGGLAAGSTGNAGVGLIENEGEITGGLDREVIAQYIKSKLGQILYCYERQLSANPDLFGKVAVKFTIGPTGQVEQQLIGDTTLKNSNVEGCILSRVASWKFPSPEGGTRVIVTYPFLFKSTN